MSVHQGHFLVPFERLRYRSAEDISGHMQRRIRDLVGENIPEDEAKLLSNGKFTCLVCSYKPIFDTIDTLLVHRGGKKHEQGAAIFLEKQRELKNLIEKRRAEHFEKHGNTNIKIAQEHMNNKRLMSSIPYDARSKKLKPYERKPKISISSADALSHSTDTSRLPDLPGTSKSKWGHKNSSFEPIMHDAKLKNIFRPPECDSTIFKPYISKRQNLTQHSASQSNMTATNAVQIDSNIDKTVPSSIKNTVIQNSASDTKPTLENLDKNSPRVITEEQRQLSEKIQQLRGAGWKRDWDGKWIKDEDAEFDSDEEPPDI